MLLPPWNENQEVTRPWFVRLRELREGLIATGSRGGALRHLSMGMSHDFEAAIEEGATMVRVGTAIFGKRTMNGAAARERGLQAAEEGNAHGTSATSLEHIGSRGPDRRPPSA